MEKEPQSSGERLPRVEHEAREALDRLEVSHEQLETAENKQEQVDAARQAVERHSETRGKVAEVSQQPRHIPTHIDKLRNYRDTIKSVQRRFPPAARTFSKFIHSEPVERTSEALEVTVMRPSVTMGATLTALIVGGFFFFTARKYGFRLSGSEFVLSLLVGAGLGFAVEMLWKLVRGVFRR